MNFYPIENQIITTVCENGYIQEKNVLFRPLLIYFHRGLISDIKPEKYDAKTATPRRVPSDPKFKFG